jgi:hypothetical protein
VGDRSRGRFTTPADCSRHDHSSYSHVHVRRASLGFVHRPRAIFCRLLRIRILCLSRVYPLSPTLSPSLSRTVSTTAARLLLRRPPAPLPSTTAPPPPPLLLPASTLTATRMRRERGGDAAAGDVTGVLSTRADDAWLAETAPRCGRCCVLADPRARATFCCAPPTRTHALRERRSLVRQRHGGSVTQR